MHSRYLQFTVQEDADIVQVIVRESNDEEKIIRKIPSDEIVRLIARRNEILGFLLRYGRLIGMIPREKGAMSVR